MRYKQYSDMKNIQMHKSIGIYGIIRIYKNQLSERKSYPATDFLYSCIALKFLKALIHRFPSAYTAFERCTSTPISK